MSSSTNIDRHAEYNKGKLFLIIVGTCVVIFADRLKGDPSVYWVICGGMLIIGIAQGLVETFINPLAATVYPDDKTHKLNVLHAWWPGGIIIGGLLGLALGELN